MQTKSAKQVRKLVAGVGLTIVVASSSVSALGVVHADETKKQPEIEKTAQNGLSVKVDTTALDKTARDAKALGMTVNTKTMLTKMTTPDEIANVIKAVNADSVKQANVNQKKINDFKVKKAVFEANHKTWEAQKTSHDAAVKAYNTAKAKYDKDKKAYDAAMVKYNSDEAAYQKAKTKYNTDKKAYDVAVVKYNNAMKVYNIAKTKYDKDKKAYDIALAKYNTDMAAYKKSKAAYDQAIKDNAAKKADYEKKLAAYHAEMKDYNKIIRDTGEFKAKQMADLIGMNNLPNVTKLQSGNAEGKMALDHSKAQSMSVDQVWNAVHKYGLASNGWLSQEHIKSKADVAKLMSDGTHVLISPKNGQSVTYKHAFVDEKTGRDVDYTVTFDNIKHFGNKVAGQPDILEINTRFIGFTSSKPVKSVQYHAKMTYSDDHKPANMTLLVGAGDIDADQYFKLLSNGGFANTKHVQGSKIALKNGGAYSSDGEPSEGTDTSNQIWFVLHNQSSFDYEFGAENPTPKDSHYEDVFHQFGGDGLNFVKPKVPYAPKLVTPVKPKEPVKPIAPKAPVKPTPVGKAPVAPKAPVKPSAPVEPKKPVELAQEPKAPTGSIDVQKTAVFESIKAVKAVTGDATGLIKDAKTIAQPDITQGKQTAKPVDAKAKVNLNGQTVVVGKELTYDLSVSQLPAGRKALTAYTLDDKIPEGLRTDAKLAAKNLDTKLWKAETKDGHAKYSATPELLKQMNVNKDKAFDVKPATLTGVATKADVALENEFDVSVNQEGDKTPVTGHSNKVVNKTPKIAKGAIHKQINDKDDQDVVAPGHDYNYTLDVTMGNADKDGKAVSDNIISDQLEKPVIFKNVKSVKSDNKDLETQMQTAIKDAKVGKDNKLIWDVKDSAKYAGSKVKIVLDTKLDEKADYAKYTKDHKIIVPNTAELSGTPVDTDGKGPKTATPTKSNTVNAVSDVVEAPKKEVPKTPEKQEPKPEAPKKDLATTSGAKRGVIVSVVSVVVASLGGLVFWKKH